jgi:hypothetical protein
MKLTEKDKKFLKDLKQLIDSGELWIELKMARPSYMVLKGTYGQKLHSVFQMSRQGVRWRFQRVFGEIYVSAFESILTIEKTFGSSLRDNAVKISRQRYQYSRHVLQNCGFQSAERLLENQNRDQNEQIDKDHF